MTNSLHPNGPRRTPLPPAERSVEGVPTPRSAPSLPPDRASKSAGVTATSAPTAATATHPGKPRDAFFDNAKYLAIVLVAMGHAWEPLKGQSRVLEAAYMVVYAFHMPAFIIISGYFSRSFDMRADRLKRLVTGVAVPYVVFEVRMSSSSAGPTTIRRCRSACSTPGSSPGSCARCSSGG